VDYEDGLGGQNDYDQYYDQFINDLQRDTSSRVASAIPLTVLITELDSGTLILQGRPDGPRVRLSPSDGVPLKRALAAAFGRTELIAAGDDQGPIQ
jgi:hypothetical protein